VVITDDVCLCEMCVWTYDKNKCQIRNMVQTEVKDKLWDCICDLWMDKEHSCKRNFEKI
jgi:hypothetical protein